MRAPASARWRAPTSSAGRRAGRCPARARRRLGPVARRRAWPRPRSSAPGLALAAARRGSAMTRARSAAVPAMRRLPLDLGHRTAWSRSASANRPPRRSRRSGSARRAVPRAGHRRGCGHGCRGSSASATACERVAAALDRKTDAPIGMERPRRSGEPLRVASVHPGQGDHDGQVAPGRGRGRLGRRMASARLVGRVGVRAVAEHQVQEQHAAGRRRRPRTAIRSIRRVGSIIGWARPWVSPSSPKSMTSVASGAGRRR
jgi:hypothetical protein